MNEGFHSKPTDVKDAIAEGNVEALRAMGKKGAERKKELAEFTEDAKTRAWKELYESEISRLKSQYPDNIDEEGNEIPPEVLEEQARQVADAIFRMREAQIQMLKKK